MSEKVYGIAESKSKVEVPRKTDVYDKSETYSKSECFSKIETYSQTQITSIFLKKSDGAPKNHASTANTYGLGTGTNFGHCKLTTSLDVPLGDQDGIALAGSVGYTLKQYIDNAVSVLQSMCQIPVGGVYWSFNLNGNVAQTLGYGTWAYCGNVNYSAVPSGQTQATVYAYRRVS